MSAYKNALHLQKIQKNAKALLVLAVLFDVIKSQRQDLQDDFVEDFDPVLLLIVICHRSKMIKN